MKIKVTGTRLTVHDNPNFSGSGGTPPKKPHAPVKKPGKKPKK